MADRISYDSYSRVQYISISTYVEVMKQVED